MKQIIAVIIPYLALPVCMLLLAGLTGFGIVVALDVWGDIYFVKGLPLAVAFIVIVSVAGLVFLQPASEPFTFTRIGAGVLSQVAQLRHVMPKTSADSRFETQEPEIPTNNADSDPVISGPTSYRDRQSPVHSVVVWGKRMKGAYNFNCSVKSEANKEC